MLCKKRWFKLTKDEDEDEVKINPNKIFFNLRYPYFVYNSFGNYYCLHCKKKGYLKHFCIY